MDTLQLDDVTTIVALTLGLTGVLVSFMVAFVQMRKGRYDEKMHRMELEMMRRSLESQLYSVTDKLVATESRWKDVNHLLLSSQGRQPTLVSDLPSVPYTSFLESSGITHDDLRVDDDLVFVLTPFHPRFGDTFDAISIVCRDLGFKALRGDEENVIGDVFPHILKQIVRARLIIANIEGRNPNVFYELGIAHGLGKASILVSKVLEDAPFDLRTKRIVLYHSPDDLRSSLKNELARSLVRHRMR